MIHTFRPPLLSHFLSNKLPAGLVFRVPQLWRPLLEVYRVAAWGCNAHFKAGSQRSKNRDVFPVHVFVCPPRREEIASSGAKRESKSYTSRIRESERERESVIKRCVEKVLSAIISPVVALSVGFVDGREKKRFLISLSWS